MPPSFGEEFRGQLRTLFRWRRDVRRFRTDRLPEGMLDRLLALADEAPSVGLSQPWRFITVDEPGRRASVRESFERCNEAALAGQRGERGAVYARLKLAGLDDAPAHVAVCVDPDPAQGGGLGRATQPETASYSAVLAVHTFWLAARAEGVGIGWVSILEPETVLQALEVPTAWRLVAYLCVGYPKEQSPVPELEVAGWECRRVGRILRR